jgi:hypothetical protein
MFMETVREEVLLHGDTWRGEICVHSNNTALKSTTTSSGQYWLAAALAAAHGVGSYYHVILNRISKYNSRREINSNRNSKYDSIN